MRVSVELISRDLGQLQQELQMIKSNFAAVNTVNIPDVMRLNVRSWEGAAFSKPFYDNTIPHLRAIDFNLKKSRFSNILNGTRLRKFSSLPGMLRRI